MSCRVCQSFLCAELVLAATLCWWHQRVVVMGGSEGHGGCAGEGPRFPNKTFWFSSLPSCRGTFEEWPKKKKKTNLCEIEPRNLTVNGYRASCSLLFLHLACRHWPHSPPPLPVPPFSFPGHLIDVLPTRHIPFFPVAGAFSEQSAARLAALPRASLQLLAARSLLQ